ncbi:MAG TPA: sigma-70 family RNA polymerase sigma factor [Thermomicrobiales bacterium]|nr:sigma-70 family RNA polymerase sigma factor [Thermomicrobiales bacterium]
MHARLRGLAGRQRTEAAETDWAAVYAEYLPRVYNYFRFRTGDNLLAEDLTAQTFEQAWRGRARYRHDLGAFSTWLFTIARRVAAGRFRRQPAMLTVPLESVAAQPAHSDVEEIVERRSELARLQRLLADLPVREREVIELKYGALLTNRAIARVTGLSESNVGTLLHRTVQRLRTSWEEEEHA